MADISDERKDPTPEAVDGNTPDQSASEKKGFSRRSFLQGMGLAAGVAAVPVGLSPKKAAAQTSGKSLGPGKIKLALNINGKNQSVDIEPRVTLLEALRDEAELTGSKKVCDRGACGACTVLVDGESVCSCMMLAVDARGKKVTTIEGLAPSDDKLDPIQQAFIDEDALQCGFCTPGFIMRSRALLNENPDPSLDEIKDGLSGNICRCGTYTNIFDAVQSAAKKGA